ncbi:MAG: Mth938-like domain-containing protein [Caldimicrobium sp.]
MITYYTFGKLIFKGTSFTKDLILLIKPNFEKILYPWWRKEGHLLQEEDLEEVFAFQPKYLIVGKGAYGVMQLSPKVIDRAKKEGIQVEAYLTQEAIYHFNELLKSGFAIAGAFHLTC